MSDQWDRDLQPEAEPPKPAEDASQEPPIVAPDGPVPPLPPSEPAEPAPDAEPPPAEPPKGEQAPRSSSLLGTIADPAYTSADSIRGRRK